MCKNHENVPHSGNRSYCQPRSLDCPVAALEQCYMLIKLSRSSELTLQNTMLYRFLIKAGTFEIRIGNILGLGVVGTLHNYNFKYCESLHISSGGTVRIFLRFSGDPVTLRAQCLVYHDSCHSSTKPCISMTLEI